MVIILSIVESDSELVSGIPEFVEFSTNVPSTVFYTIDGTDPDEDSYMAAGKVLLPTNGTTLTLKAIAISGTMSSEVLEEVYFTDQTDLDKTRLLNREGINLLPPDETPVNNLSFNADGSPAQQSSISFVDLDLKTSTSDRIGEEIPGDSSIEFIRFPIKTIDEGPQAVSSPNRIDFDPKAQLIVIDGSTEEALENQLVRVINRPMGTIDVVSPFLQGQPAELDLISGNFVRAMLNPNTGKMVYYYRESRENRWVKSVQTVEPKILNLTKKETAPAGLVFRWIEDRSMTKIY